MYFFIYMYNVIIGYYVHSIITCIYIFVKRRMNSYASHTYKRFYSKRRRPHRSGIIDYVSTSTRTVSAIYLKSHLSFSIYFECLYIHVVFGYTVPPTTYLITGHVFISIQLLFCCAEPPIITKIIPFFPE